MSKRIKLDLADLAGKLEAGTLTATERARLAMALRDITAFGIVAEVVVEKCP